MRKPGTDHGFRRRSLSRSDELKTVVCPLYGLYGRCAAIEP